MADGSCVALWLVSFSQKGFPIGFGSSPDPRFAMIDDTRGTFERELVHGRFGDEIVLERHYEPGTSDLSSVHMAYKTEEGLIFRVDNPDQWSYQYDQMRSQFLIKPSEASMQDLARSARPLFREIFDGGWAQSIYSGEIVVFKND
jgi:hypothetical protein